MSSVANRTLLAPIGYERRRMLLSIAGTSLLLLVAVVMAVRGVDRTEVVAALLYVPVFVVLMAFGARGGALAGVAAALVYIGMRLSLAEVIGAERFMGLIGFRAAAYVGFGAIGGWAAQQLESPLRKLEDHDLIDDTTGLFNARFFVRHTRLESARADRYGTPFSIVSFDIPVETWSGERKSTRVTAIRNIAALILSRIRTVDRAVHADAADEQMFAVVLAETPRGGAKVVERGLAVAIEQALENSMSRAGVAIRTTCVTYPEQREALAEIQARFQNVDRIEHPDEAGEDV